MKIAVPLVNLLPTKMDFSHLASEGLHVEYHDAPPASPTPFIISAASWSEIEKVLRLSRVEPSRVLVICPLPAGMPGQTLWLSPELLATPQGVSFLRAWLNSRATLPLGALAKVANHLKSSLAVVTGASSLLLSYGGLNGRMQGYLGAIDRYAHSLSEFTDDLRDYVGFANGQLAVTSSNFNLPYLARTTFRAIDGARLCSSVLTARLELDPGLPDWVRGDPGRLRQVLSHLLRNAIRFTESGSVVLHVERLDEDLIGFQVRDTGPGIPHHMQQDVFDPFLTGDESLEGIGVGLGLAVSRAVVRELGGTLAVESTVGEGSTFSFSLKFDEVRDHRALKRLSVSGQKILLVGSEPELLLEPLLGFRATTSTASSLDEAERVALRLAPDLFIFDLGLGGFQALETLAERALGVPIVAYRSEGQRGDVARCANFGIRGYLSGALEPEVLEQALALVLFGDSSDIITRHSALELLTG